MDNIMVELITDFKKGDENKFILIVEKMGLLLNKYVNLLYKDEKEALNYPQNSRYGLSSKKCIKGIYKKVGYILIILVAISTDFLIYHFAAEMKIQDDGNTIFSLLVVIWLIINESISILENANRMGAILPTFIKLILLEMRKNIDTPHVESNINNDTSELEK